MLLWKKPQQEPYVVHLVTPFLQVIDNLATAFGPLYRYENVVLSGTHTHSGPAGYLQYVLFEVTSLGFVDETFQGLVTGITEVQNCTN